MQIILSMDNFGNFLSAHTLQITLGVISSLLAMVVVGISRQRTYSMGGKYTYSVSGIWVSHFSGLKNRDIYEFIYVTHSGEIIKVRYQSYLINNDNMELRAGIGKGVSKGNFVVCPYTATNISSPVIGSYHLKVIKIESKTYLVGYYVQRADDNEDGVFIYGKMVFAKVEMNFVQRVKGLFTKYFSSREDLLKYLDRPEIRKALKHSKEIHEELPEMLSEKEWLNLSQQINLDGNFNIFH